MAPVTFLVIFPPTPVVVRNHRKRTRSLTARPIKHLTREEVEALTSQECNQNCQACSLATTQLQTSSNFAVGGKKIFAAVSARIFAG